MDFDPNSWAQASALGLALYVTVQNLGKRMDRLHEALLELARQVAHRNAVTPPPIRRSDDYPPYGGTD